MSFSFITYTICGAARYFARIRALGVLLALKLTSGNSACSCQPASWVCNAATKIHQTDKEGRHSFQDGVRSQPFRGKQCALLHRYFAETGKGNI